MPVKAIADILNEVAELPTRKEKIERLRKNNHIGLQKFLEMMFDDNIVWLLPEGIPPYTPNHLIDVEGRLYHELRRLYLFQRGKADNLNQKRREHLFIEILEAVTPADAELLILLKDKKPLKGINKKLVEEAFGVFL
jgi:hypothetical protein